MRTVEQVLDAHGITPKRGGMIHCPAHDDSNPSCKASEEYVYCFTCGWSADAAGLEAKLTDRPVGDVLREWNDGNSAQYQSKLRKRSARELKAEKYLDWVFLSQAEIESVRAHIAGWRMPEDSQIDMYDLALAQVEGLMKVVRDLRDDEDVTPFEYTKRIESALTLMVGWGRRWRRELA